MLLALNIVDQVVSIFDVVHCFIKKYNRNKYLLIDCYIRSILKYIGCQ